MRNINFEEAVAEITKTDNRFTSDAYFFVKEALDFTVKQLNDFNQPHYRHVTAKELLYGFRDYTLEEFGAMGLTVLHTWGIYNCKHIGIIVFHLVNQGILGKKEEDSLDDFKEVFNFYDTFQKPFKPKSKTVKRNLRNDFAL
jgi:uncharacterized repeat protein (TIGR04138 family)